MSGKSTRPHGRRERGDRRGWRGTDGSHTTRAWQEQTSHGGGRSREAWGKTIDVVPPKDPKRCKTTRRTLPLPTRMNGTTREEKMPRESRRKQPGRSNECHADRGRIHHPTPQTSERILPSTPSVPVTNPTHLQRHCTATPTSIPSSWMDPCTIDQLFLLSHQNMPLNFQCPCWRGCMPEFLGHEDLERGALEPGVRRRRRMAHEATEWITGTCRTKPCACNMHRNVDARPRRGRDGNMGRSERSGRTSRCAAPRRNLETCT